MASRANKEARADRDRTQQRGARAFLRGERLILFGRSLGGAFAAYTASHNPVAGLILESTFTNAKDMANKMFPILPVGWFMSSELDALSHVAHLSVPKLMLHGTADTIIPYTLGRELYQGAAEPKEFYSIAGAGHNDTIRVGGSDYFDKIKEFITRTVAGQATAEQESGRTE